MNLNTLNDKELNNLQRLAIERLQHIFQNKEISNLGLEIHYNEGVNGIYDGQLNIMIEIKFAINLFCFEFYFHFDQLEFYISKNNVTLYRCIVEDFYPENKMIEVFYSRLTTALITVNLLS